MLQHAFDRLTSLIESGRTVVSNASGSTLERDDELTPYNPISYQLAYFALVSVDHLRFVRDAISTRQDLAVMAEYSVIRSAIEASAYAVWLATGGTRIKRVKNSLRLSWDSASDAAALMRVAGDDRNHLLEIEDRLLEIQAAGPARQGSIENMPSITEVLMIADRHVNTGQISGLEAWRICSGIAHSNPQVALALLEHTWIDKDGGLSRIANNVDLLATVYEIGVTYLEAALAAWRRLAENPAAALR